MKIPLTRRAFLKEEQTKKALADFILTADRLSMDIECKFSNATGIYPELPVEDLLIIENLLKK
ncbi:hypothetical protein BC749_106133 [Flavobacterium araucananum]|uniref:Uncharacterized protein n=1 Tax=Flavobacterium araucananum TaxID=946678 RepID=A0A227PG33_9FLAO|nr:hypothetical protein [Flavobacterium araucananum]OXG08782.1 hypothetical protein B0A64_04985 [Flavobacterium araucananum]PWJ97726.1 hypothetical protein BC749_106133 [Flavobacterium araucananum]